MSTKQSVSPQGRLHIERMVSMLTDNLHVYEEQAAGFGELYVPPFLVRQIQETKSEIERLNEQLAQFSPGAVEDNIVAKAPHNLPSKIQLVDRSEELSTLIAAFQDPCTAVAIIEGLTGTGKTALACNLANQMWDTGSFVGAVWVSAESGILTINSFIDTVATVLDYPYIVRLAAEEKILAAQNVLRTQKSSWFWMDMKRLSLTK